MSNKVNESRDGIRIIAPSKIANKYWQKLGELINKIMKDFNIEKKDAWEALSAGAKYNQTHESHDHDKAPKLYEDFEDFSETL